jgi:serine protease Do
MQKNILYSIASSFVVSTLIIGGFLLFTQSPEKEDSTHKTPQQWVKNVNLQDQVPASGPDFTLIASKVVDAVVHIKSMKSVSSDPQNYQYPELPEQFRHFFREDPFERYFFRRDGQENKGQPRMQYGQGSGVIIKPNGYIVTNNHVVENADELEVTLHDNRTYEAKIIGTDPSTDLALIKIDEEALTPLAFEDSDGVKIGEWVMAVGNPFNLNSTVTAGIVSAIGRNINILKEQYAVESFIQTDAAINPGNSGGALVNMQGKLIGINTAIASPTGAYSGYGFAVPANIVQKVVMDLMEYGVVQRGVLGIMIRTVNGKLAEEEDLNVMEGVYVDSIMSNSAAGEAGIQAGDVITHIDGIPVKSSPKLQETIARHRPGDVVEIALNRRGKDKSYMVTLKNKTGDAQLVSKENKALFDLLGADFQDISAEQAEELEIEGGIQLTALYAGKLRQNTNIREGFIVTKVDGQIVKDVKSFAKYLQNKKGGVMLEGVYENRDGVFYYAFGL